MLRLALPVVTVQVGTMTMGAVDTLMVGHVSPQALAAVALGNLYFFAIAIFGNGTLMVLDPVVAQAVGAGDHEGIARAVQRGLVLTLLLGSAATLCYLPARTVFTVLRQPPDVVPGASRYVLLSIPGVFPVLGFVVLRQSLQAMHRVAPIVWTIVGTNLVNVALNWVFVYGHLGSPALGVSGSAIATSASRWLMPIVLLAAAWAPLRGSLHPWRRGTIALAPLRRLLHLGLPIGVQFELEYAAFGAIALLMGRIGTVPMAAHQIAINLAALTFMVPLGVGAAAAVLVGNAVGRGDDDGGRRAAAAALLCGVGFMCASAVGFLAAPTALARLYSADAPVVALASSLIPIAGIFQVFDGMQGVSAGILRGVGDTRAPSVINLLGFWLLGLPSSAWLAFRAGAGPEGLWWGLVVGLAAVAVLLLARVRSRLRQGTQRLHVEPGAAPAP